MGSTYLNNRWVNLFQKTKKISLDRQILTSPPPPSPSIFYLILKSFNLSPNKTTSIHITNLKVRVHTLHGGSSEQ